MKLVAPYRFIPISGWVHQPAWAARASHDHPFEDGASGWLDLKISAKTPLLVGAERRPLPGNAGSEVQFFRLPDGTPAIPGTSLRGLIRSVVEIAGFGRAAFIDDRRYGLRDLYNPDFYTKRMTSGNGDGVPIRYLMKAGWLTGGRGSNATITPCEWAKVHVSDLIRISGTTAAEWQPRESAPGRYRIWGTTALARSLPVDNVEQPYPHSGGLTISYRRAGGSATGPTTPRAGTIVLTGKPAHGTLTENKKKKFEFFFYDLPPRRAAIPVADLWKDFELIHEEQLGAAGGTGNRAWPDYWKAKFRTGLPVPVFYLEEAGRITSFGLASMFRMAYESTTHDLLRNASPRHLDETVEDFAHLLFGRAADRDGEAGAGPGRRGRVAFEPARLEREMPAMPAVGAILASPKPQFYPAYVKQKADGGALTTTKYASYGPIAGDTAPHRRQPELAGRKRYPVRPWPPPGYGDGAAQMQTTLHPLAAGSVFAGRVRFHNLRPAELGALVWALRLWAPCWGKRPKLRHALGMGKPYGFGAVEIAITAARIEANAPLADGRRDLLADGENDQAIAAAQGYADRFAEHMETAWQAATKDSRNSTWAASEQIEMLLGLARTASEEAAADLRGLALPEFRQIKSQKRTLPDAPRQSARGGDPGSRTDEDNFPRPSAHATAASLNLAAPHPMPAPAIAPAATAGVDARLVPGTKVTVFKATNEATVVEPKGPNRAVVQFGNGRRETVQIRFLRLADRPMRPD